jgi:hypothetical protein
MRLRRGLLLVLILYVTLDLSVPVVGGAFVFEAAERLERLQVSRARGASDGVVTPRLPDVGPAPTPRLQCPGTPATIPEAPPARDHVVGRHLPRAALAPASPDAH